MDFKEANKAIIEEFRGNEGKCGAYFEGQSMVLLHTTGAKSGAERVNPLVYLPGEGDRFYVFASKAGAPENPDWYHNLTAYPQVTYELATETGVKNGTGVAREITDRAERDRLYAAQVARVPGFAEYEKSTTRLIPVIAIDPD